MKSNIPIYMITMQDHPISLMYTRECKPSWEDYILKPFEAVTPKDLAYKSKLDFNPMKTVGKKRPFTATEKAVWYSHFELWCKCVHRGPLIVIEHDSKLIEPLPDLSKEGYKFLSFINRDFGETGIHMAPGSGYYITPPIAERLVATAVARPIRMNSDGHLCEILNYKRQKKMNDFHYIEQINFDGLNTIDHVTPNRKFIGPDYEDIDIPSIHRQT